jgi:hypothetical protein
MVSKVIIKKGSSTQIFFHESCPESWAPTFNSTFVNEKLTTSSRVNQETYLFPPTIVSLLFSYHSRHTIREHHQQHQQFRSPIVTDTQRHDDRGIVTAHSRVSGAIF